jgi:hypothetical protein
MGDSRGQGFGSGPCPACDAAIAEGELCMTHRAALERGVPTPLVKRLPPKERAADVGQLHWELESGLGAEAGKGQGAEDADPAAEAVVPGDVLGVPGSSDVLGVRPGGADETSLRQLRDGDVGQHMQGREGSGHGTHPAQARGPLNGELGHGAPDLLYVVVLLICIVFLFHMLGLLDGRW